jgi:hypothetical protein
MRKRRRRRRRSKTVMEQVSKVAEGEGSYSLLCPSSTRTLRIEHCKAYSRITIRNREANRRLSSLAIPRLQWPVLIMRYNRRWFLLIKLSSGKAPLLLLLFLIRVGGRRRRALGSLYQTTTLRCIEELLVAQTRWRGFHWRIFRVIRAAVAVMNASF